MFYLFRTIVATVKEIVKITCFKVTEIYRVMLDALYQGLAAGTHQIWIQQNNSKNYLILKCKVDLKIQVSSLDYMSYSVAGKVAGDPRYTSMSQMITCCLESGFGNDVATVCNLMNHYSIHGLAKMHSYLPLRLRIFAVTNSCIPCSSYQKWHGYMSCH